MWEQVTFRFSFSFLVRCFYWYFSCFYLVIIFFLLIKASCWELKELFLWTHIQLLKQINQNTVFVLLSHTFFLAGSEILSYPPTPHPPSPPLPTHTRAVMGFIDTSLLVLTLVYCSEAAGLLFLLVNNWTIRFFCSVSLLTDILIADTSCSG